MGFALFWTRPVSAIFCVHFGHFGHFFDVIVGLFYLFSTSDALFHSPPFMEVAVDIVIQHQRYNFFSCISMHSLLAVYSAKISKKFWPLVSLTHTATPNINSNGITSGPSRLLPPDNGHSQSSTAQEEEEKKPPSTEAVFYPQDGWFFAKSSRLHRLHPPWSVQEQGRAPQKRDGPPC